MKNYIHGIKNSRRLLAIALAFGAVVGVGASARIDASAKPGARVVTRANSIDVSIDLSPFELRPTGEALRAPFAPHELQVPGLRNSVSPGLPSLPANSMMLALPPDSDARLITGELSYHEVRGVWIAPPATTPIDVVPGEEAQFISQPDPDVYATDAFIPANPVAISTRGVARDIDFVKVELNPFQWNPVRGILRVYDRIEFRVEHSSGRSVPMGASDRTRPTQGRVRLDEGPRTSLTLGSGLGATGSGVLAEEMFAESMFANSPIPASWRLQRPPSAPDRDRLGKSRNVAATTEAYKIEVAADGLYVVSFAQLQASGLAGPVRFSDLKLQLRGRQVGLIPVDLNSDGWLDSIDSIRFFGRANPGRFTTTHIYWLTVAGGGHTMPAVDAFPQGNGGWPAVTTGRALARHEVNESQFSATPVHPSVWEPWVRKTALASTSGAPCFGPPNTNTADLTLSAANVASPYPGRGYELRGRFVSMPPGACIPTAQEIVIGFNGQLAGTLSWTVNPLNLLGTAAYPIDAARVVNGSNIVHLDQPVLAGSLRRTFVDWVEFDYEADLVAVGEKLEVVGEWPNGARIFTSGFSGINVEAVDVRSDGLIQRLVGVRSLSNDPSLPPSVAFALEPTTARHHVYITAVPQLTSPAVYRDTSSDLRNSANRAEHLTIAHGDFVSASAPLAAHRVAQGMTAMVVDVQDVYDEFSWGNVDSSAIRDFLILATSADSWATPPLYVVLVGDTTVDFKDYRQFGVRLFIPHGEYVMLDSSSGRLFASDSYYATIVGNDPIPDLLIGRIPAQSAADVTTYVDKLIRYENRPAGDVWNNRAIYVIDDNMLSSDNSCSASQDALELAIENAVCCYLNAAPPGDHEVMLEDLYGHPQGHDVIVDERNNGIALWLYYGHSSISRLGKKCETNLLDIYGNSDVNLLTNSDALPLFAPIACNVGMIDWVDSVTGASQSMSEVFVLHANGELGFIASTSRVSFSDGLGQLDGMLDGLFWPGSTYLPPMTWGLTDRSRRAGAIHFASQLGHLRNPRVTPVTSEDSARTLLLVGDPAARLKITQPPPPDTSRCPQPTWCLH